MVLGHCKYWQVLLQEMYNFIVQLIFYKGKGPLARVLSSARLRWSHGGDYILLVLPLREDRPLVIHICVFGKFPLS